MNQAPITLEHGERYGTLTVLGPVKTKNGLKFRVGCVTCGYKKQLVRASRFNKGREKCIRLSLHSSFDGDAAMRHSGRGSR